MFAMFAGGSSYAHLVDVAKGAPAFGATKEWDGESCREVTFPTVVMGSCTVLIGEQTGIARHWDFDMTRTGLAPGTAATPSYAPKLVLAFEATDLKLNEPIDPARFDIAAAMKPKVGLPPSSTRSPR